MSRSALWCRASTCVRAETSGSYFPSRGCCTAVLYFLWPKESFLFPSMREGHSTPLTRPTFFFVVAVTCNCLHVLQVIFFLYYTNMFYLFFSLCKFKNNLFWSKSFSTITKGPIFVHSLTFYTEICHLKCGLYLILTAFTSRGPYIWKYTPMTLGPSLWSSLSVCIVTMCKTWEAFMHIMLVHVVFIFYHWICKISLFMP